MSVHSPHEVARSARRGAWTVGVLAVGLFVLAAAIVFAELRTPEVWDPLGDYPLQHVLSDVPGIPGPAARLDGTVDVEAVKCGADEGVTNVSTELVWKSVDPPGAAWPRGGSVAERAPGCEAQVFSNQVPPEVRELVLAQIDAGYRRPTWIITGTETPVRGAETGVPRRWRTENFVLVPWVWHHLVDAAKDHAVAACAATVNLAVAALAGLVSIVGAEVNDGLLTGAALFVLATFSGIAGWALILLVRLSQVVSRLEEATADHDRRLASGGL